MKPRRIADLAQLSDKEVFPQVSKGLELIHENATRIWESVDTLAGRREFRAAEILKGVALEEAAKYLILLDAVRCPRKPDEKRYSDQLRKFNDHLARGLYAETCDWRPADFKEVRVGVERECKAYYLDGPNGVDWIFRNDIKREREEGLYVDYVQYDDKHEWVSPKTREAMAATFFFGEPTALQLIRKLHGVGIANSPALTVVAEIWRPKQFTDDTHLNECCEIVTETLQALADGQLLASDDRETHAFIISRWPFPLYDLPMRILDVKEEELHEIQRNWHPEI